MDEQGTEHVEEVDLEPAAPVRKRRPKGLWAMLAAVAVVAGAVVVVSPDDDGNERPGLPVDLASQSGAETAAADSSMRAWVTYVPGDDLPALGGEATAYRLSGEVDEADVRALADALGLDGAVETDGSSWSVAGADGLGRLDVHAGFGASWSYYSGGDCVSEEGGVVGCAGGGSSASAGSVDSRTSVSCDGSAPECTVTTAIAPAEPCIEATDDVAVDCAAVPPGTPPPCPPDANCLTPEDCAVREGTESTCPDDTTTDTATARPLLTGEDEARAAALEVVAASGANVDGARVDAQSGGASWFVTVEPVVDGIPTGMMSFIEVTGDAVVTSGNGFLGQPEPLGEYPLLDTRAVIDRANSQSGVGVAPALGDDGVSSTTGADDAPTTTAVTGADPCLASDGCNDVAVAEEPTTTTIPCKVQPDGREICELETEATCEELAEDNLITCGGIECPQAAPSGDAVAPEDPAVGAPETIDCAPPVGDPVPEPDPVGEPIPQPQPLEIVLVDAEPSLLLLPANDDSGDAYLVPAYRFSSEDGGTVDLPAVAEESLAGPSTTDTTVPDTVVTEPEPVPEPQPCEVLTEQDPGTETTHTIQTCPTPEEEQDTLEIGGKGYYVDIDTQCAGGTFVLASRVWITRDQAVAGWADPGERHEGGTFTLDAEDHGTFVGDAAETKVAEFETLGPNEDIFCTPEPRG